MGHGACGVVDLGIDFLLVKSAELVEGGDKWAFFGFSMLTFIPVIYELCRLDKKEVDAQVYDTAGNVEPDNFGTAPARNGGAVQPYIWFYRSYRNMMNVTVVTWSLYPLVWILAEGTNTLTANGEAIFYTVLDIISKAFFGYLIVSCRRNTMAQLQSSGYKVTQTGDLDANFATYTSTRSVKKTAGSSDL